MVSSTTTSTTGESGLNGQHEELVHDVRLSSVVPASITGEGKVHELSNMDLMMKLHYVKGVYFFNGEAAGGLSINDLKKPMFECLGSVDGYSHLSGRIRKDDGGRPFVKCNDSGVRVAEAKCSKTLDEWLMLGLIAEHGQYYDDQLIYCQFLGPPDSCGFTPLVFVQFTWFKCGGLAIGFSWAHILGDAFSASHFINNWAQFLAAAQQLPSLNLHTSYNNNNQPDNKKAHLVAKVPLSIQRVQLDAAAGANWLVPNQKKMKTHSFHITAKQLNQLARETTNKQLVAEPFKLISALMWKSLAKIRGKLEEEPKIVTLITSTRRDDDDQEMNYDQLPSNSGVMISTIEVNAAAIAEADLAELAKLMGEKQEDETNSVEELMDHRKGGVNDDFVLYGARLTFVNLEKMDIYDGAKLQGHGPVFASYSLSGVGDEGAILVLPGGGGGHYASGKENGGRLINLILPEAEVEQLKFLLRTDWGI